MLSNLLFRLRDSGVIRRKPSTGDEEMLWTLEL
jgi:hypothetical protein